LSMDTIRMTVIFDNDSDIIVDALEKVIAYARITQQIFVAQCVWWLVSIIGLVQGLVSHIDHLSKRPEMRTEENPQSVTGANDITEHKRIVSPMPRDIQEDPRLGSDRNLIHLERVTQVENTFPDSSVLDLNVGEHSLQREIIESTEMFDNKSRMERKAFNTQKKVDQLSRWKSAKVIGKPLPKGVRRYLQYIPKNMIRKYRDNKKYDLRPCALVLTRGV